MNIWFGTTTKNLSSYQKYYRRIREYLIQSGFVINFDWLEDAIKYKNEHPKGQRNIKKLYAKVLEAIDQADVSIIEYTVPNFSSSHQITYSLQKRKPTLVLRLRKDNSFADSYIEALESRLLTIKNYNLKNYKEIIDEFIGFCKIEIGFSRYNIVLENTHKYFLDWAANKYQKSRSQIIRDLISQKMKKDQAYKKYLTSRS